MHMTAQCWLVVGGICGAIMLAGCAPGSVRSVVPVRIGQSSPQAIVEAFHKAIREADYAVMLECMEPPAQREYDEILAFSKLFTDALASASCAVEQRIGRDEADELRMKAWPGFLLPPLRDVEKDGALQWNRIDIKASGEQAEVFVQGERSRRLVAKRYSGRWYIGRDFEAGPPPKEEIGWWKKVLLASRREADEIRKRVVDGRINRANFEAEFWHVDSVAMGPPLDGVSLQILPAVGPVYRKGEPLTFRLWAGIDYEWGKHPRHMCWRMPPDGWGDNVVVEVDGVPLHRESSQAKVIWGWAEKDFPEIERWTVTLPEDIGFKSGKHRVRYILISEGGTYTNRFGDTAPMLKGRLVSNLLKFTIE